MGQQERLPVAMRLSLRWDGKVTVLDASAAPCCPMSWHSRRCPRVARSSRFRGDTTCHTITRRDRIHSTSVVRICARGLRRREDRCRNLHDMEAASSLTQEVFLTQVIETSPLHSPYAGHKISRGGSCVERPVDVHEPSCVGVTAKQMSLTR